MDRPSSARAVAAQDPTRRPRQGRLLPAAGRLRARPTRHNPPVTRRRTRIPGPYPSEVPRDPAPVPHHRPQRRAASHRHHRGRPDGADLRRPHADRVLPVRDRRSGRTLFSVLCASPWRQSHRRGGTVRISPRRGCPGRRLGSVGARSRGHRGHVGRPVRARIPRPGRRARRTQPRSAGTEGQCPGRAVGLLGRRSGLSVGGRGAGELRARAQHRRRGPRRCRGPVPPRADAAGAPAEEPAGR